MAWLGVARTGSGGQEGSAAGSAPRRTCGRAVLPGWWRRERGWQENAAVDRQRREVGAVAEPPVGFAGLLRKLRREARLTQEELAEAAGVSLRAVSYLERGVVTSPQKDTVRLLADALGLIGPARAGFEAAARGRAVPGGVAAATRTLPRDIASFTGRQQELEQLTKAVAAAGGGGGHPRDRRDGRGGQDRVRGTRRAPARGPVPGRADLPAAARAHPRAAAGGSRGCAG